MSVDRERLLHVAEVALRDMVDLQADEELVIATNPGEERHAITTALYETACELHGRPVLVIQPPKHPLDYAERAMLAAIRSQPDVLISISQFKLGRDPHGLHLGWIGREGKKYPHVFDWTIYGERRSRGFWAPGITLDTFLRTVDIDYALLGQRASRLADLLTRAQTLRITTPAGADLTIDLRDRKAMKDDGDYRRPGHGGNLPAGEAFISPAIGGANGLAVFDGTLAVDGGSVRPDEPVRVTFRDGFATAVEPASQAARALLGAIEASEARARQLDRPDVERNARHLGEVGFGLNPAARMVGNMLEDEKLLDSCHLAIGANYDRDAEALNHFDCLMLHPTVYLDGERVELY